MKREHLWAAVWLLLATAACFSRQIQHPGDLFVGPQDQGQNDVTRQVLAYRTLLPVGVQQTGQIPFWNPWVMGGAPWLGNPQSGLFYPPNWLYFCIPEVDCVNWLVFGHHWWAGLGTYLLARRWGLSWLAGVGAGTFFLGAPYMLAQTCEGHVSQVCLMSWAPWLWLAYERIRSGQPGGVPHTALVLSLAFFCGHIQELFYLVVMFSLFALWDGWVLRDERTGSVRWWIPVKWFTAGVLTAGMVAVEFLSIWVYLRRAFRAGGVSVAQASQGSLELRSLWQLLDPLAYGGPQNSLRPESYAWGTYWESIFYFGIGPALLAIWGACRGQGRYPAGRLVGVVIITVLFSFGDKTPLFPLLHQYVPGVGMFRAPMRALFHASFAIALLGGLGLDVMLSAFGKDQVAVQRQARTYWGWVFAIGCVGCLLAVAAVGPFEVVLGKWPQIHWLRAFGYVVGVALSMLMCISLPDQRRLWTGLCLLACLTDLALHGWLITRTVPMQTWRQTNPIVERVRKEMGSGRLSAPQILVSDREAWQAGIAKIQAYEPVPLVLWGEFLTALCPKENPAKMLTGFTPTPLAPFSSNLLDLLGVKYAAVGGHAEQPRAGWKLVERGQIPTETVLRDGRKGQIPYTLLENLHPLPRAYVVYGARRVQEKEVKDSLKNLDPRTEVIVDHRFPEFPETQAGLDLTPVEIVQYQPNRIVLKVPPLKQAEGKTAFLCLTDLFYPGWSAAWNGQPVEIFPGNLAFRVIPLPSNSPGEMVLTFTPPGTRLGGTISAVAWVVWLFLTGLSMRFSTIAHVKRSAVAGST